MPGFEMPMINLCSRDLPRVVGFHSALGFAEVFRRPDALRAPGAIHGTRTDA